MDNENDIIFGEHDLHASHLDLNRVLPHFPWRQLFEHFRFELPYPAAIYADAQADAIYRGVVDLLVELMMQDVADINVDLTFTGNPDDATDACGLLSVEVSLTAPLSPEWAALDISPDLLVHCLRLATLDWVLANENYGSEIAVTPIDASHWQLKAAH